MRIGVTFPGREIGNDVTVIRDFAQAAEDLGYDYIAAPDHVLGADHSVHPELAGFPYTHETPVHEPFVLLSYLAGFTRRILLMTNILVLPQRQTALVAKQAAELDILSGGRLILGVGVGWNPVEYRAMGQGFARRSSNMAKQIALLRRLWDEPLVTVDDGVHDIDHAALAPRPGRRIPIWVGGMGPRAIELIGRSADGWSPRQYLSGDQGVWEADMLERRERIFAAAGTAGRDPAEISVALRVGGSTTEAHVAMARHWQEIGATHCSLVTEGGASYKNPGAGLPPRAHIEALSAFREAYGDLR